MTLLLRLLCAIGFHHWEYAASPYAPFATCRRCGGIRG